jgi:hypothetical protein
MRFAAVDKCPALPDELWQLIIELNVAAYGLRAAKMLRTQARTARVFAEQSRNHEDNNLPPKPWDFSAVHDSDSDDDM